MEGLPPLEGPELNIEKEQKENKAKVVSLSKKLLAVTAALGVSVASYMSNEHGSTDTVQEKKHNKDETKLVEPRPTPQPIQEKVEPVVPKPEFYSPVEEYHPKTHTMTPEEKRIDREENELEGPLPQK